MKPIDRRRQKVIFASISHSEPSRAPRIYGEGRRWQVDVSFLASGPGKGKGCFQHIRANLNTVSFLCISVLENHTVAPTPASGVSFPLVCRFLRCSISRRYQINNLICSNIPHCSVSYQAPKTPQSEILTI